MVGLVLDNEKTQNFCFFFNIAGLRKELNKMGKIIENITRPQILRYEAEKKKINSMIVDQPRVQCKNNQLPSLDKKKVNISKSKIMSAKSFIDQLRKRDSM